MADRTTITIPYPAASLYDRSCLVDKDATIHIHLTVDQALEAYQAVRERGQAVDKYIREHRRHGGRDIALLRAYRQQHTTLLELDHIISAALSNNGL